MIPIFCRSASFKANVSPAKPLPMMRVSNSSNLIIELSRRPDYSKSIACLEQVFLASTLFQTKVQAGFAGVR